MPQASKGNTLLFLSIQVLISDELSNYNPKKKKFPNIIQYINGFCDMPSDSLIVECITNQVWLTLTDVPTNMMDAVETLYNNKDGLFETMPIISIFASYSVSFKSQ
jgi:hypothetical protein